VHGAGANTLLHSGVGKVFNEITPACIWWMRDVSSTPRTATVDSVADDVITLKANESEFFFTSDEEYARNMENNCYVKIANTSKDPVEYAWVKAAPAVNTLQVTVAANIAGWADGNTISTAFDGDASRFVDIDISPIIPANGTGIFANMIVLDTADPILAWKGIAMRRDSDSWLVSVYPQVPSLAMSGVGFCAITENRHLQVRDRASAVSTCYSQIWVLAYII